MSVLFLLQEALSPLCIYKDDPAGCASEVSLQIPLNEVTVRNLELSDSITFATDMTNTVLDVADFNGLSFDFTNSKWQGLTFDLTASAATDVGTVLKLTTNVKLIPSLPNAITVVNFESPLSSLPEESTGKILATTATITISMQDDEVPFNDQLLSIGSGTIAIKYLGAANDLLTLNFGGTAATSYFTIAKNKIIYGQMTNLFTFSADQKIQSLTTAIDAAGVVAQNKFTFNVNADISLLVGTTTVETSNYLSISCGTANTEFLVNDVDTKQPYTSGTNVEILYKTKCFCTLQAEECTDYTKPQATIISEAEIGNAQRILVNGATTLDLGVFPAAAPLDFTTKKWVFTTFDLTLTVTDDWTNDITLAEHTLFSSPLTTGKITIDTLVAPISALQTTAASITVSTKTKIIMPLTTPSADLTNAMASIVPTGAIEFSIVSDTPITDLKLAFSGTSTGSQVKIGDIDYIYGESTLPHFISCTNEFQAVTVSATTKPSNLEFTVAVTPTTTLAIDSANTVGDGFITVASSVAFTFLIIQPVTNPTPYIAGAQATLLYSSKILCLYPDGSDPTGCTTGYNEKSVTAVTEEEIKDATRIVLGADVELDLAKFATAAGFDFEAVFKSEHKLTLTGTKVFTGSLTLCENVVIGTAADVEVSGLIAPITSLPAASKTIKAATATISFTDEDFTNLDAFKDETMVLTLNYVSAEAEEVQLSFDGTATSSKFTFQTKAFVFGARVATFVFTFAVAPTSVTTSVPNSVAVADDKFSIVVGSNTKLLIGSQYKSTNNEFLSVTNAGTYYILQQDATHKPYGTSAATLNYHLPNYCFTDSTPCTTTWSPLTFAPSGSLTNDIFKESTSKVYIFGTISSELSLFAVENAVDFTDADKFVFAPSSKLTVTQLITDHNQYQITANDHIIFGDSDFPVTTLVMSATSFTDVKRNKVTANDITIAVSGASPTSISNFDRLHSKSPIKFKLATAKTAGSLNLDYDNKKIIFNQFTAVLRKWTTYLCSYSFEATDPLVTFDLTYAFASTPFPKIFTAKLTSTTKVSIGENSVTTPVEKPFMTLEGVSDPIQIKCAAVLENLAKGPFTSSGVIEIIPSTYVCLAIKTDQTKCNAYNQVAIVGEGTWKEVLSAATSKVVVLSAITHTITDFIPVSDHIFSMTNYEMKEGSSITFTTGTDNQAQITLIEGAFLEAGTYEFKTLTTPPSCIKSITQQIKANSVTIIVSPQQTETMYDASIPVAFDSPSISYTVTGATVSFDFKEQEKMTLNNNVFGLPADKKPTILSSVDMSTFTLTSSLGATPITGTKRVLVQVKTTTSLAVGAGFEAAQTKSIVEISVTDFNTHAFQVDVPPGLYLRGNEPFVASQDGITFTYNIQSSVCCIFAQKEGSDACGQVEGADPVENDKHDIIHGKFINNKIKIIIIEDLSLPASCFITSTSDISIPVDKFDYRGTLTITFPTKASSQLLDAPDYNLIQIPDNQKLVLKMDSYIIDTLNCYGQYLKEVTNTAISTKFYFCVDPTAETTYDVIGAAKIIMDPSTTTPWYVVNSQVISAEFDPKTRLVQFGKCKVSWPDQEVQVSNTATGESTVTELTMNFIPSTEVPALTSNIEIMVQKTTSVQILDGFKALQTPKIVVNAYNMGADDTLNVVVPEGSQNIVSAPHGQEGTINQVTPKPPPTPKPDDDFPGWAIAVIVIVVVIVVAVVVVLVLNFTGIIHLCGNKDDAPSV